MKYLMHLSEEDMKKLMEEVISERIASVEKSLSYLTEYRDNEFLKMTEVTKILHVTDRTIRTWVKAKKLRCHWIGDRQFFRMKDIVDAMTTNY